MRKCSGTKWQQSKQRVSPISAFVIRNGTVNDAENLLIVHRESILRLGVSVYTPEECESWSAGLKVQGYSDAMCEGGETFFVAERDGQITGFCSFKDDEVIGLYVHPEFCRTGTGSLLLQAAEKQIAQNGYKGVHLNAALSAEKFYRACGFSSLGKLTWKTRGGLEIKICKMARNFANHSPASPAQG